MRPLLILAPLLALGLVTAGCSRSDADRLKDDTRAVGHDVAGDVRKVGDDPHLKSAGDELKAAAHATGEDLHKAGDDIGHHAKAAANDTRDAAER
jgi:hypothetical protein